MLDLYESECIDQRHREIGDHQGNALDDLHLSFTLTSRSRTVSKFGTIAEDLESALNAACEKAGTDKVIVFDGSFGRINVSPSMGKYLRYNERNTIYMCVCFYSLFPSLRPQFE